MRVFEPEPGPEPKSPSEAALIRSIQAFLRTLGDSDVPVDGRLGSKTRAAIHRFQQTPDYTGPATGKAMPDLALLQLDIGRAIARRAAAQAAEAPAKGSKPIHPADAEGW